ncbi:sugar ABC transporter ATP-binding protein [Ruminococcus bromii]|uniref:sugar ABC transporter ATP-binding protein n=1 Tax=Ruminococcus bromii TaxID=40518 RepID=UPI003FD84E1D
MEYSLELKNICKSFSGVQVLKNVSFRAYRGKVNVIIGENGAGKSTLMRILSGAIPKDSGDIYIDNKPVDIESTSDSFRHGIAMIYQELNLVNQLTAMENLTLGREISRWGFIDKKALEGQMLKIFEQYQIDIDLNAYVEDLSVAKRQLLEITKAISFDAKIIVMDEPTSSLTLPEVEHLFKIVRILSEKGITIIYISHRFEEIFEIGDYVSVLRDGEFVGEYKLSDVTRDELVSQMVGRNVSAMFPKPKVELGEVFFKVENLTKEDCFENISFELRRGEILGFSGLVGAGRTELALSIFGYYKYDSGTISLDGEDLKVSAPGDAMKKGIAYISEDRKKLGVNVNATIKDNISITNLERMSRGSFVNSKKEADFCNNASRDLHVKATSILQMVANLSGGNQQKVVLAKWIFRDLKLLILDEPTRGIDVGAKEEIHYLIGELAKKGIGIILISSELPEVLGMSDRVLVMHEGKQRAILDAAEATQEKVMQLSI